MFKKNLFKLIFDNKGCVKPSVGTVDAILHLNFLIEF